MNVTVTPAAEKFMSRMVRLSGGGGFRLEVSPGGCSGLSSTFDIHQAPMDGDQVLKLGSVSIFLPAASAALLEGYTVDFVDAMMDSGLKFTNPAAASSCCGTAAPSTISIDSIRRSSAG